MAKRKTTVLKKFDAFDNQGPRDRAELQQWAHTIGGLWLPMRGVCEGHDSPLDYLSYAFFEGRESRSAESAASPDSVVWACRGGGKTTLGALATMLDLIYKPGIQVRIVGGSLEQAERMYAALRGLFDRADLDVLKGQPTKRGLRLNNGSACTIVAQSEKAVRGLRVQKVRCDEVELFDRGIWQAVQLVTRSDAGTGAVEALSTMHVPGGLMQELIGSQRRIFRWCLWDVIARCEPARVCETCPLFEGCRGRAKQADGFISVPDAIAMKGRVSRRVWEQEMLCHPPKVERAVFGAFAIDRHVRAHQTARQLARGEKVALDGRQFMMEQLVGAVDFGFAGAFVCLWIMVLVDEQGKRAMWVVDEMVYSEVILRQCVAAMGARAVEHGSRNGGGGNWLLDMVFCDVAGKARNGQTGISDARILKDAGFKVACGHMEIEEGLRGLNELMDPAHGPARFFVDPRCIKLIAALQGYARDRDGLPVKDGVHDHLIDALRYAVVGEGKGVMVKMY